MNTVLLGGAALAAVIAVPLLAQADERGAPETQTRADAEMRVKRQFDRMDANRDGYLTQDEQDTRQERRGERREGWRETMFDRLDTNRDGVLDRAEFTARQAAADGEGRRGRGLARMDADGDGNVSLAEMTAARMRRFDRMDVNRDGAVSGEERDQRRARRCGD